MTHPLLQEINLDYNDREFLISQQLQSHPAILPLSLADEEKINADDVAWLAIGKEQAPHEMYGRSNSMINNILWLVVLVWATMTLAMECVCVVILSCAH